MDRNRILMLFGAAWVSAALLTWFLYANTIAPKQERRTFVMAAAHDLPVGTLVRKADLKRVAMLPRDIPGGGILNEKDALNRVVLYPVTANEPFVASKLSLLTGAEGMQATIEPGYRAVSVQITDVSGVAGLILPGAHVDVLFTRPGNMAEAITSTILQNVKVMSIGHSVQTGQLIDPKAPKAPVATLVVTPADAQKLELAKNEGRISLALRNPLDASSGVDGSPVTTDVLDPTMKPKVMIRNNPPPPPNLRELHPVEVVKKDPAPPRPPRAVVEVFRGDKHVEETFHE